MNSVLATLFLQFSHSRSYYGKPYDSTIGVGAGFYWFAAGILLFLVLGTLKAFQDDRKWTGVLTS